VGGGGARHRGRPVFAGRARRASIATYRAMRILLIEDEREMAACVRQGSI
jgi:hypothetical protein